MHDQWDELYRRHYSEVYLYALSLCRDHHRAQDLTSDTFFQAILSLDEEKSYFKYWLFRVCRNLFLDGIRRDRNIDRATDLALLPDGGNSPLDQLIQSEQRQRLYHQILGLTEGDREILILFYFSELPIREIAGIRGIREGTARVQLHRARAALKSRMEGNR